MDQVTRKIDKETVVANEIFTYLNCFQSLNGKYKCLVAGCESSFTEKSSAIKHLKRMHADIHEAIDFVKSTKANKSCEVKITETPGKIWHAILQLIIFCALPFSIVHEWGFQLLIKPYVTAFKSTNSNFSVNRSSIRKKISEQAKQIKEIIIGEVKGKMICLLIDIASKYNRSVLGISIVFYGNGKLHTRTIGMVPLKIAHTGKNLFEIVKNKLHEFNINLNQIFAVTTDNGRNIIKMVKLFRANETDNLNAPTHTSVSETDEDDDDDDDNDDDEHEIICNWDQANDEIFDPEIFNDEYFTDLLTNLRCEFSTSSYNGLLTGISCAAHCLHLVVDAAIKSSSDHLIEKCRTLAKKLRTPKLRAELSEQKQKMAKLDVNTRWSSLFDMVCMQI